VQVIGGEFYLPGRVTVTLWSSYRDKKLHNEGLELLYETEEFERLKSKTGKELQNRYNIIPL